MMNAMTCELCHENPPVRMVSIAVRTETACGQSKAVKVECRIIPVCECCMAEVGEPATYNHAQAIVRQVNANERYQQGRSRTERLAGVGGKTS